MHSLVDTNCNLSDFACIFFILTSCMQEATTICPAPCDLLTLKVVSQSRVTLATSVPILVFLGLSVLDLGPMYACCARTAWVTRRCRPSSGQSPSPSCYTHPPPGSASPTQLTSSESMRSYVAAFAAATARRTLRHSRNFVKPQTNSCSITLVATRTMYCTAFSPRRQQLPRTINFDPVPTVNNCRDTLDI